MYKASYNKFIFLLISIFSIINSHTDYASIIPLNAAVHVVKDWCNGYQLNIDVSNPSASPTISWSVQFNLINNETVSLCCNASYQNSGQSFTFNNESWNAVIPPQGTISFQIVILNATCQRQTPTLTAMGTIKQPLLVPAAPVLNPISVNPSTPSNYVVSWNSVPNAVSYTLQRATNSNFTDAIQAAQTTMLSQAFNNQSNGTYYYRGYASNSAGNSPSSNVVSVTLNATPSVKAFVESYWESWNGSPSVNTIANMKVDIINISFATFQRIGTNTFTVMGVDSDQNTMRALISAAHQAGKKVKISIGGATYPLSQLLTSSADALGLAQAITQYVQYNALDGVDFDIEDHPAANLQIELLKNTRQLLGSNALISYTAGTPASTTQPFAQVIQGGYQYLNYVSLMAYDAYQGYNYQQDVHTLLSMGVPAAKIVVGLMPGKDDIGITTSLSQISTAAQFVIQNKLAGIMFWDLNRDYTNTTGLGASAATNTAYSIIHA